jgi:hypothetical protein
MLIRHLPSEPVKLRLTLPRALLVSSVDMALTLAVVIGLSPAIQGAHLALGIASAGAAACLLIASTRLHQTLVEHV